MALPVFGFCDRLGSEEQRALPIPTYRITPFVRASRAPSPRLRRPGPTLWAVCGVLGNGRTRLYLEAQQGAKSSVASVESKLMPAGLYERLCRWTHFYRTA